MDGTRNEILINPRWPEADRQFLEDRARFHLQEQGLQEHFVLTSSGTTAESWRAVKLIYLSRSAFFAAAGLTVKEFGLKAQDVLLQSLPRFHVGGLSLEARAMVSGASLVSFNEAWEPRRFTAFLQQESVSGLSLVPTQLFDLVTLKLSPPTSVRWVWIGGGALSAELEKQALALGWPVIATYGMTETSAMIARREPGEVNYRAFSGIEVRLSEQGHLKVKSPGLATGVVTFQRGVSTWTPMGEWYETQDRAVFSGSRWSLLGRDSDFVKIKGESVNVQALREIFVSVAAELSVDFHLLARPDERDGAQIILVVKAQSLPAKLDEIRQAFAERVLPFERIHEMVGVREIPRTELGKVRELELLRSLSGDIEWKK